MLFSEVKKVLAGNFEEAFDSITEEMSRHRCYDEEPLYDFDYGPDEYVTLTWHGYSIKIHYKGSYRNCKNDCLQGYVYVPGKAPTEEEFNELFGNLNGRTLNEVMKFLKAFADITLTGYHEMSGCQFEMAWEKEHIGITPEERERHHLEWEISDEVSDSEEGKERRRNMSYDDWEAWLEDEVQRRVEEKLKAKETEKKNNGDTDGPDGCSP